MRNLGSTLIDLQRGRENEIRFLIRDRTSRDCRAGLECVPSPGSRSHAGRLEIKVEGGSLSEACFDAKAEKCSRGQASSRVLEPLDRSSFNRTTDQGLKGRRQIFRRPLFTLVYGCWRVSVGVPNSLTDRTAIRSDRSLHISLENQQIGPKSGAIAG
jgi:hypothetical protein